VNLAYAALASSAGAWLRRHLGGCRVLDRLAGGLFIALGIRLALARRSSQRGSFVFLTEP